MSLLGFTKIAEAITNATWTEEGTTNKNTTDALYAIADAIGRVALTLEAFTGPEVGRALEGLASLTLSIKEERHDGR